MDTSTKILSTVKQYWGFERLRPLQEEAIRAGLEGRDSLVVLPTGGGKSLCYQVPSAVVGRTDIVASPLFRRRRKRKKLGLRLKCGYDLRASKDICPECGTAIPMHVSVTVNPAERFSRLSFPGPSERFFSYDPPVGGPDYTTYECDRCSTHIRLELHNFVNASAQPVTNLSPDDDRQMTGAIGRARACIRRWFPRLACKAGLGTDSYLDWYCPGCGRAARVYYSAWAGGRHGEVFVDILRLLES